MLIGYARVSTTEQNLDLQIDALTLAGCEKLFSDTMSGSKDKRPGLEQALSHLRQDDVLVVWRLDRLGRSLNHLVTTVDELSTNGIQFKSLIEGIDTSTSIGKLHLGIFGSLAEFERNLIRERTLAGLAAARARGRIGGRPRKYSEKLLKYAYEQVQNGDSVKDVCKGLDINRNAYFRYTSQLK